MSLAESSLHVKEDVPYTMHMVFLQYRLFSNTIALCSVYNYVEDCYSVFCVVLSHVTKCTGSDWLKVM